MGEALHRLGVKPGAGGLYLTPESTGEVRSIFTDGHRVFVLN